MSVYPQVEESHLAPGYRLDRYELLFPIGMGGMASVWVARLLGKHGFERLFAIKTILSRHARDPHFQQLFLDEARIASRIHHPNVAQILDLGDQHGVLFIAMEWIEGDALSKLAHAVHHGGEVFPPRIALRILADVCAGLHAAHELCDRSGAPLGIVHRDVSPHNILIDEQGVAKVIDFGIAKARDRVSEDTETGSFKGKVKYMAPEQALSPRSTDRRADLWAVGAILHFLVSGRLPYDRENDFATLTQLASGKPPLPLPNSVPEPVRLIAARALAWERDQRYATAAELQAALEDAMVEIGGTPTNADVAAFCGKYLADRTKARKDAVALALSAAEERARVSILLAPSKESSGKFRLGSQVGSGPASRAMAGKSPMDAAPGNRVSETSPTLGTAATMTTNPATPGSLSMTRLWPIAAALVFSALVLVFAMVHRGNAVSAGSPPPQPPAEAVATSAAPPPSPMVTAAVTETTAAPGTEASAASKGAPTVPVAGRRRPTPARPPTPAPPNQNSPVAPGATNHRAAYGF